MTHHVAAKAEIAFDLTYMVCFEPGAVACYMVRHRAQLWDSSGDSFTVHLLADDRRIGFGWSKDDAVFDAACRYGEEIAAAADTPCTCRGRVAS